MVLVSNAAKEAKKVGVSDRKEQHSEDGGDKDTQRWIYFSDYPQTNEVGPSGSNDQFERVCHV